MSYDLPSDHRDMVFDQRRNAAYARALACHVTPQSIVLDLGAGLGVLGLMAARLGAARVHFVEPASVIHCAEQVARDNGLHNCVFHRTTAEELTLEQQADIITSVFTGNFLLEEDLLPSLFTARDRWLAPGGVLLPDRARMRVAPVMATQYYRDHVACWREDSAGDAGIAALSFAAVGERAANTPLYDSGDAFGATELASPATLTELDFSSADVAACDATLAFRAHRSGQCHGWLGWFDMRLDDAWYSTAPDAGPTHWRQVLLPLPEPLPLAEGDEIQLRLSRPQRGDWSWLTRSKHLHYRQSGFLARAITAQDLKPR